MWPTASGLPICLYMPVNKARAVTARIIDMDDINFDIYTGPVEDTGRESARAVRYPPRVSSPIQTWWADPRVIILRVVISASTPDLKKWRAAYLW